MSNQTNRATCYFCGDNGPLETHHIIPRRHGGPDHEDNLVDVCPSCHAKLERLYGDEVFEGLKGLHDSLREAEYCPACYRPVTHDMDKCIHCGVKFENLPYDAKHPEHVVILDKTRFDGMLKFALESEDEASAPYFPTVLEDKYEELPEKWLPEFKQSKFEPSKFEPSKSQRDRLELVKNTIEELDSNDSSGADVEQVVDQLVWEGFDRAKAKSAIEKLKQQGNAYEPEKGALRTA